MKAKQITKVLNKSKPKKAFISRIKGSLILRRNYFICLTPLFYVGIIALSQGYLHFHSCNVPKTWPGFCSKYCERLCEFGVEIRPETRCIEPAALKGSFFYLFQVAILTFSSLVYFAEKEGHDESNGQINSWTFVESFWWGLMTITTVGYDLSPKTFLGKLIGGFCALSGA